MVSLKVQVIEELDEVTPHYLDLVIPESPKQGPVFKDSITLISDIDFSLSDLELLAII